MNNINSFIAHVVQGDKVKALESLKACVDDKIKDRAARILREKSVNSTKSK